jgi:hypothetical protein
MKAAPLSDDAFALRAIPFSGPIPSPIWPGGVDLDGETFTHRTDIKPDWFKTGTMTLTRPASWATRRPSGSVDSGHRSRAR